MDLKSLPGIVPTSSINILTLSGIVGDSAFVELIVAGKLIFSDSFAVVDGTLELWNFGDMVIDAAGDAVAPSCSIQVSADGGCLAESFIAVVTRIDLDRPDFNSSFLVSSAPTLAPPGARFALAAVGSDIRETGLPSLSLSFVNDGSDMIHDSMLVEGKLSGAAAVYEFDLPEKPGLYRADLGNRHHFFVVAPMSGHHVIFCRNCLNAPEYIYLRAKVTLQRTRTVNTAQVGGRATEYDMKLVSEYEVSASGLPECLFIPVSLLPSASSISIDGVPAAVSELKTQYSRETDELFECKFTATLSRNLLTPANAAARSRIFRTQFDPSFN
ncbi:MAG: hypothetical protein K2I45_03045 [Muribaculaceae bacterium]|nr:hypothetical protein [Muribaculaceae bacterium]